MNKQKSKQREIKFRYWNTVTNQMVIDPKMPYKEGWTIEQLFSDRGWIWMQYTGLLDRNDKEIYEGDLLGYPNKEILSVVRFGNYNFLGDEYGVSGVGFYLECIEAGEIIPMQNGIYRAFGDSDTIIGNIYENSSLLDNPEQKSKEQTMDDTIAEVAAVQKRDVRLYKARQRLKRVWFNVVIKAGTETYEPDKIDVRVFLDDSVLGKLLGTIDITSDVLELLETTHDNT